MRHTIVIKVVSEATGEEKTLGAVLSPNGYERGSHDFFIREKWNEFCRTLQDSDLDFLPFLAKYGYEATDKPMSVSLWTE